MYILNDARLVLYSSGNPFVVLLAVTSISPWRNISSFRMTFPAGEASPTTSLVVSFTEPVELAGGNASFRIALFGVGQRFCVARTQ